MYQAEIFQAEIFLAEILRGMRFPVSPLPAAAIKKACVEMQSLLSSNSLLTRTEYVMGVRDKLLCLC